MDYYTHNAGRAPAWDVIESPPMMVSEADTAEDRAAFAWAWARACRERGWEAYAQMLLEGAQ